LAAQAPLRQTLRIAYRRRARLTRRPWSRQDAAPRCFCADGALMNGAESLIATLAASGVEMCFANPGTSEMHFVAALDRVAGMRCVLGLFEGVATGAADGYWRMARRPAATLLHLGPGLGNGLANLHNAKKAQSGVVNIVGDHAVAHARFESPLRSDVEAIAALVSHWVKTAASSLDVARDGAQAVAAARDGAVGRIATLVLPADTAWGPGGEVAIAPPPSMPQPPRPEAVRAAAEVLTERGSRAVLLLGAGGVSERAREAAASIAAKTGCRLLAEFYNARMPGGRGRVRVDRLPYAVDAAVEKLAGAECLVLAGAAEPIAFFAYPGKPSELKPAGCTTLRLADARDDVPAALEALRDELGAQPARLAAGERSTDVAALRNAGKLTPDLIADVLAALLPENAIVVDEAVSTGRAFGPCFASAAPHDWLAVMGGAIGFGLPAALGSALGAPGRPVLALEGDGSAMYTPQALWSIARESLPVVAVIFANRAYRILQGELKGVGAELAGPKAEAMLRLDRPAIDWVALARSLGVPGARARTAGELVREVQRGFASGGPYLVEVVL
jgi:acetolactate synthase-1/2/3 large subunit